MWGTGPGSVWRLHGVGRGDHLAAHARRSRCKKASARGGALRMSDIRCMNITIDIDEHNEAALVEKIAPRVIESLREDGLIGSPYFTTEEAGEYLRVKPARIREMVCRGQLAGYKHGRRLLVLREDIYALVRPNDRHLTVSA
jgi:excisionase family DNA binding protein